MELAEKIKMLRKQRGMTLEQVGNIVGVGKSTVRKWECGMIDNIHRNNIAGLAKAFSVSPGYLMGWEEEPCPATDTEAPAPVQLNDEERELVFIYRGLNVDGRKMLLTTARAYGGSDVLQKVSRTEVTAS